MVSRAASFGKRAVAAAPRVVARAMPARDPDERPVAVAPPSVAATLVARFPYFTLVLTAILGVRFVMEMRGATDWSGANAPGHFSLLAMGASDRAQVLGHGEWWRLFTQSVLHGSPSHLIGNLITFLVVGFFLEPMIGVGWFSAIYFTGGFAGAVLSMLMNPADVLSVGASGAIMATLAALFTLSFHSGAPFPNLMRRLAGGALFPALIPSISRDGAVVDTFAHMGGAGAGVVLAFVILIFWREEDEHPPGRSLAAIVSALWLAMTALAFAMSGGTYAGYAKGGLDYIPPGELPSGMEEMKANSFALVTKYPKDPRAHVFRGLYFLSLNDASDAEPYFRSAQRLSLSGPVMTPAFANWSKALLAISVAYQGRKDEAATIAAPVCGDAQAHELLQAARLCGASAP